MQLTVAILHHDAMATLVKKFIIEPNDVKVPDVALKNARFNSRSLALLAADGQQEVEDNADGRRRGDGG